MPLIKLCWITILAIDTLFYSYPLTTLPRQLLAVPYSQRPRISPRILFTLKPAGDAAIDGPI